MGAMGTLRLHENDGIGRNPAMIFARIDLVARFIHSLIQLQSSVKSQI